MRTYRFHSLTDTGAQQLADALNEDGMRAVVQPPDTHKLPGWGVQADGENRSESLLEMLAQFFGGAYEGEDLAGT